MKTIHFLMILAIAVSCQNQTKPSVKKGIAEVNGTQLYYEMAGSGDPVILIHGWSFDTRCWDDQFNELSRSYQLLRYDLRGFGKSSLPVAGQTYSHTDDLLELMNFLEIGKAHILGHSFGGRIAIDMALNHPERVMSLMLPDAAMDVKGIKLSRELTEWIGNTWKAGKEEGIKKAKEIWIKASPLEPAMHNPNSAAIVKQMIGDYSGWHWENDDPCKRIKPYPPERLNDIKVPTLILVGELNPKDYHIMADIQNKHISDSRREMVTGAGHALNIENPEEFNSYVLEFLEDVSE
jgi:pimeloyl-ACP methyl ester carboxylesterase